MTDQTPATEAGRRLLDNEKYNERSFVLITAEAILAIEAEAAPLDVDVLARALDGFTWTEFWHEDSRRTTPQGYEIVASSLDAKQAAEAIARAYAEEGGADD